MKIEILRGPSGSGKSYYAGSLLMYSKDDIEIISRDTIREELLGQLYDCYSNQIPDYNIEEVITTEEHKRLAKAIIKGKHIIIDNTNIRRKYVQEYINIFNDLDVSPEDVEIKDFSESFETCKERISKRTQKKLSDEILKMQFDAYNNGNSWHATTFLDDKGNWITTRDKKKWYYLPIEIIPYEPDIESPKAVIVDIDGTLAKRNFYVDRHNVKIRKFTEYLDADTDVVRPFTKRIVKSLMLDGLHIIFLSGRKEESREVTQEWLEKNLSISFEKDENIELHMRNDFLEDGTTPDHRKDYIIKYELFNKYVRTKYNVIGWIDDRRQVLSLIEELNIPAMNAGSLNEEY